MFMMADLEKKTEAPQPKSNPVREWLFRLLVLAGGALILYTWFQPWWSIDIEGFGNDMVQIRPWGLEMSQRMGGFAIYLKGAEMPSWWGPFVWTFLGLMLLALLVGMFIRGDLPLRKPKISFAQFLIGGAGLAYLATGVIMAVYASIRMKAMMDVPLVGTGYIDFGDPLIANVYTRLTQGYYLIFAASGLLLFLALFRKLITGHR
jgi:hypothetical protein